MNGDFTPSPEAVAAADTVRDAVQKLENPDERFLLLLGYTIAAGQDCGVNDSVTFKFIVDLFWHSLLAAEGPTTRNVRLITAIARAIDDVRHTDRPSADEGGESPPTGE